ncbi:hypothetical protein J6590_063047 [Homalodisca vitripennis]|nr:hypothetical protein J6590_063047 [Homalodisca vitripennis]
MAGFSPGVKYGTESGFRHFKKEGRGSVDLFEYASRPVISKYVSHRPATRPVEDIVRNSVNRLSAGAVFPGNIAPLRRKPHNRRAMMTSGF